MMNYRMQCIVAAGLALTASFAAQANSTELRYATGFSTGTPIVDAAELWADKVSEATGGDLRISVYALSLLNHAETSAGLRDGLADAGNLTVAYDPGRYPIMEYLSDLTFAVAPTQGSKDSLGYAGAIAEFVMLGCPDCRAEFGAQNQVYTGSTSSAPHDLLCAADPITTKEDFSGKRIRVGTEAYSRFAEAFGGAPTRISANEILEAFNQGVVDCAVLSAGEIKNYRMEEVIDSVTLGVPGGSYSGITTANFNMDSWQSLSDEHRKVLIDAAADLSGHMSWDYLNVRQVAIDEAKERGTNLVEPSAETAEAVKQYRADQMDFLVGYYEEMHGLENAQQIADDFEPILLKWIDLVADVESGAELSELYRSEVFSKVDAATYGMN